jgi:glycosyltransferase involved in cell wall biosynthesis
MAFIQFYYGKRITFGPADENIPGLGGSEGSLLVLSRELARRGHRVEVYNACWAPGEYDGVLWKGAWDIDSAETPDVRVSVRTADSVLENDAPVQIFWMLDDRPDGAIRFRELYPNSPIILASDTMSDILDGRGIHNNINKIFLPVNERYLRERRLPSEGTYCLYSSMPNRGLKALLHMWFEVKRAVPEARLLVTSGWELWGYTKEEARDKWLSVMGIVDVPPGVELCGVVSKEHLSRLQAGCRFSVIPSDFPEMFCLAAAEIERYGKPLIVSNYKALSERVVNNETGYLIDGNIYNDEATKRGFIDAMIELFRDGGKADRFGAEALKYGARYSPPVVCEQWEGLFDVR